MGGEIINRINAIPGFGEDTAPINDKPWQSKELPGSGVGKFAGAVASGIPAAIATGGAGVIPQILAQAGFEGLTTEGDIIERGKAAAASAVGGVLGSAAAKVMPYLARAGSSLVAPFTEAGRQRVVGKMLQSQVGDNIPEVVTRLRNAETFVPGSAPTAAEAANSGGIAATQRWAEQANPEQYAFRRAQNASARAGALRNIAGDEEAKAASVALRKAKSAPLYEEAKAAVVGVDQQLGDMLKRPSFKTALGHVEQLAAERGAPISQGLREAIETGQGTITGNELHQLKIGLDAVLKDPKNPLANEQARALKSTIKEFEAWRETNIPVYAKAQKIYSGLSKPVNQKQIGQELYEKAKPALTDYGPLSRESSQAYAAALRDAGPTVKRATGFPGATLENTMTRKQMATLNNVAKDMARKTNADEIGRGVGSNTFQNLSTQAMAESLGVVPNWLLGLATHIPGAGGLAQAGSQAVTKNADELMKGFLSDVLLDPKRTADLLEASTSPSIVNALNAMEKYTLKPTALVTTAAGGQAGRKKKKGKR
jgi:hypothetical protein